MVLLLDSYDDFFVWDDHPIERPCFAEALQIVRRRRGFVDGMVRCGYQKFPEDHWPDSKRRILEIYPSIFRGYNLFHPYIPKTFIFYGFGVQGYPLLNQFLPYIQQHFNSKTAWSWFLLTRCDLVNVWSWDILPANGGSNVSNVSMIVHIDYNIIQYHYARKPLYVWCSLVRGIPARDLNSG